MPMSLIIRSGNGCLRGEPAFEPSFSAELPRRSLSCRDLTLPTSLNATRLLPSSPTGCLFVAPAELRRFGLGPGEPGPLPVLKNARSASDDEDAEVTSAP